MLSTVRVKVAKCGCAAVASPRFKSTVKFPKPLKTKSFGMDILHDSLWNKGMAFCRSERDRLGIRGLLPPAIRSIEVQVSRCMAHIEALPDAVSKNLYLQDLQNRNETLFHRVLLENIEMMAPLIYTPTVGTVCQECSSRNHLQCDSFFSAFQIEISLSISPRFSM